MLSIQESGLRAPLVGYTGKTAEILSEESSLKHARMKPADSARNRGKLPFIFIRFVSANLKSSKCRFTYAKQRISV
jgi:hypothetical protein